MKKHLLALAIAAAIAPAAMAQNYVIVAGGKSDVDIECAGAATCDTSGAAFKLGYGIDLGGWAVEIGYADFGKAKVADAGISGTGRASGPTVAAAWHLPLGESFGLAARVGATYLKTKVSGSISGFGSGSTSESNLNSLLGVGITYAISKAARLELAADFTKAELEEERADIKAFTIGLRYSF
jgi:OOP family OmpA-OmpF porin